MGLQMDWKKTAEKLKFDDGLSWAQVADAMEGVFPNLDRQKRMEKIRTVLRRSERYDTRQRMECLENMEPVIVKNQWKGKRTIKFGLIGDTHFNSKYVQITALHRYYDICAARGINTVYHAGDIDEGEQMRPGHQYECYTQGADDHVDEILTRYPRRDGITTKFITGNHDASMIKRCGHNIGYAIAAGRDDFVYLGQDCALVELTPNCRMEIRHPWDGTAYAISYKPQKIIDAMSGGEKPNLLAVGNYHKAEYLFYRNVHCIQVGCFQGQTPFMRGRGLAANLGGWIVEADVDSTGTLERIAPEFIPFYNAIKDDYKNRG